MIKNYFFNDKFYKDIIKRKKDLRIIREYKKIIRYKKMIKFVFQDKPLGTGDAVLKTKKLITEKYFLMLLPDDLIIKKNCSKSMISTHKRFNSPVAARKLILRLQQEYQFSCCNWRMNSPAATGEQILLLRPEN